MIRWSPAAHGLFPRTSHGLVRATLLVHARLALVPKHLLLEFILPFAAPHVLKRTRLTDSATLLRQHRSAANFDALELVVD